MNDNIDMGKSAFDFDFDSYILQSEPSKQEKGRLWQTAIGLQQVDQLKPSKYLYDTAKQNIDGKISISEAKKLIDSYYESKIVRLQQDDETEEADKVSVRIMEVLSEKTFTFSPAYLLKIHERLFKGVFHKVPAGSFRNYNITKKEWALDGDTVYYSDFDMIKQTLEYDFEVEKSFDYSSLSKEEIVKHITRFVANLWQVHAFGEGNTRTTAVFTIKYLRTLGFDAANELFEENSWYFRNALVRANYSNVKKNIYMNTEYLEKFFRNLLLGEHNELKNRYCHIKFKNNLGGTPQDAPQVTPQDKFDLILTYCEHPKSKKEIMDYLKLKDKKNFTNNYLNPLLSSGRLKFTIPDKPNSRNQKYVKNNI